jgi:hypothetical protein
LKTELGPSVFLHYNSLRSLHAKEIQKGQVQFSNSILIIGTAYNLTHAKTHLLETAGVHCVFLHSVPCMTVSLSVGAESRHQDLLSADGVMRPREADGPT